MNYTRIYFAYTLWIRETDQLVMSFVKSSTNENTKTFQSCIVCILRPALYFGCVSITPITFRCDHSQKPLSFSLELSWLSLSIAVILLLWNFVFGSLNIYSLYENHIKTWDDFLLLDAVSIHFLAVYLFWIGIYNVKMKTNELTGIGELTRNCENAGLAVFNKTFVRLAHYIVYIFVISFLSLEVLVVGLFLHKADFSLKAVRRLCTDTCIFMQGAVSTHFAVLQMVLLRLFQVILSEIKLAAEIRINEEKTNKLHKNSITDKHHFLSRICHLRRLYKGVYLNFMQFSEYINGGFLIWWNIVLMNNVLCVYVILNSIMTGEYLKMDDVFFILLHCGTLIGLTTFLIIMGIFANVVSNY